MTEEQKKEILSSPEWKNFVNSRKQTVSDVEKTQEVGDIEERIKARRQRLGISETGEKIEQQQPEEEPKKEGIFSKIGKFLTGSERLLGETYGTALATGTKDFKSAQNIPIEEADAERKIVDAIIANDKAGKDSTRLKEFLAKQKGVDIPTLEEQIPALKKTAKQIAGESLSEISKIATLGKPAGTSFGRIGAGTAIGATTGTAEALKKDEDIPNIVKSGLIGGGIGFALSGAVEGASKIFSKLGKNTYNKELQPPKKEVTKQIENNWKTFGEQVRELTDDSGKPIYQGGYNTMKKQAEAQLKEKGAKLSELAKQYDDTVTIYQGDIAKTLIPELENTFGKLSPTQIKNIQFELNRMPANFNVSDAIDFKRMYDGLIPDSYWLKAGDSNTAFNTQIKYLIRDKLRETINKKVPDGAINRLNNELSLAMDMKHLTSEQIASRSTGKISASGGVVNKILGNIWDDFIFNPALTTRFSQATLKAGKNPLIDNRITNVVTREASKLPTSTKQQE